jgi:hypothetical protein
MDPTENVRHELAAAMQRQDDLRTMEASHLRELSSIREYYAEKMRELESDRLNAIRSVDITAVQRAAEVSEIRASTLAAQVADSATALRITVEQQAAVTRASQTTELEPIKKDIADLRRVQYEAAGQKTQVVETQAKSGLNSVWIGVGLALITVLLTVGFLGLGLATYFANR